MPYWDHIIAGGAKTCASRYYVSCSTPGHFDSSMGEVFIGFDYLTLSGRGVRSVSAEEEPMRIVKSPGSTVHFRRLPSIGAFRG